MTGKRGEMKVARTHDEFYANETHKHNTKQSFQYIGEKLLQSFAGGGGQSECLSSHPKRILDIGCSNGDFLYYLSEICPESELFGIDILPSLLQRAKSDFIALGKNVPTLWVGDIATGEGLPKNQRFDVVFLNGVIGIFDDLSMPLEHFASLIDEGGVGYIWSCFNPYPLDVLIKARAFGGEHFESGWNLHSKQSVLDIFKTLGFEGVFYDDFEIGIDLPQGEDYLRTWTFKLENGKRAIVNGLGLLHHFSLLEVRRRR